MSNTKNDDSLKEKLTQENDKFENTKLEYETQIAQLKSDLNFYDQN